MNEWMVGGTNSLKQELWRRRFAVGQGKISGVWGCPGGTVVKNPPANAGDTGLSPGLGRSHMPQSNKARAPQLLSLRS